MVIRQRLRANVQCWVSNKTPRQEEQKDTEKRMFEDAGKILRLMGINVWRKCPNNGRTFLNRLTPLVGYGYLRTRKDDNKQMANLINYIIRR